MRSVICVVNVAVKAILPLNVSLQLVAILLRKTDLHGPWFEFLNLKLLVGVCFRTSDALDLIYIIWRIAKTGANVAFAGK